MIKHLRKLSPDAKRWVAGVISGLIAVSIFVFWLLHSMGFLQTAVDTTKGQGIAIFSFLDQNVEMAYNAFHEQFPQLAATSTESVGTEATSTEMTQSASSTATTTDIK